MSKHLTFRVEKFLLEHFGEELVILSCPGYAKLITFQAFAHVKRAKMIQMMVWIIASNSGKADYKRIQIIRYPE